MVFRYINHIFLQINRSYCDTSTEVLDYMCIIFFFASSEIVEVVSNLLQLFIFP